MSDTILILDFGSQFTQLIARKVREAGVYSEICSCAISLAAIQEYQPKGIILSGGPESIYKKGAPTIAKELLEVGVPILGICYGMHALAQCFSATISAASRHEYGDTTIRIECTSPLFAGIKNKAGNNPLLSVWMSHGDQILRLPNGFNIIAASDNCLIAGFENVEKKIYAVQFHPEVSHTEQGITIIHNFINICNCKKNWQMGNIADKIILEIRHKVGEEKVLVALSGGVDSSVMAVLLHRAIGDNLSCMFVDNGLLRLNEGDQVMKMFVEKLGIKVTRINAQKDFLTALAGVSDPEQKRKAIGRTFVKVFERVKIVKSSTIQWLAQGTIYPDIIESAGSKYGNAKVIKSHHNVAGLPKKLNFKIIEPLRELFKDEVREIGVYLGMDNHILNRHPFPGPGLAVRILGEVKTEYLNILRKADAIFIEELHKATWYERTSQVFAVFIPQKTVGVVGDKRRYGYLIALRAVQTNDFMTAQWADLPSRLLAVVASRIVNEIPQVSRVVYDVTSKPPATIEWE